MKWAKRKAYQTTRDVRRNASPRWRLKHEPARQGATKAGRSFVTHTRRLVLPVVRYEDLRIVKRCVAEEL